MEGMAIGERTGPPIQLRSTGAGAALADGGSTANWNVVSILIAVIRRMSPPAIAIASGETRHVTIVPLATIATNNTMAVAITALRMASTILVRRSADRVTRKKAGMVFTGPSVTKYSVNAYARSVIA